MAACRSGNRVPAGMCSVVVLGIGRRATTGPQETRCRCELTNGHKSPTLTLQTRGLSSISCTNLDLPLLPDCLLCSIQGHCLRTV